MEAENGNSNTYEEARKQRLEANKKRFQDLGISNISKSLSDLTSSNKKSKTVQQRLPKPKAANTDVVERRRSSRERKAVVLYQDDMDIDLPPMRKKSRSSSSSWASYIARPLAEVKLASHEDRIRALRVAEKFQSNLQSGYPAFVKSMGLPTQFCKDHLPKSDMDMILEDENGSTFDAKYLGNRTGLSGGWRGFALDHKLDDGDAVVFELVESNKFKLYTFRVSSPLSSQTDADIAEKGSSEDRKKFESHSSKKQNSKKEKADNIDEVCNARNSQRRTRASNKEISKKEKVDATEDHDKKDELATEMKVPSVEENDKQESNELKPRKKRAVKFFRKGA